MLGLQLFDQKNESIMQSLKADHHKSTQELCSDMFSHWLNSAKKATWDKVIAALRSPSVNLPNLAKNIEDDLDHRVCYI